MKCYTGCLAWMIVLVLLAGCAASPIPSETTPPTRLYVFDVSRWHLDHYQHCGAAGSCDTNETPPPAGMSYADLLHAYDTLIMVTTLQGIVNRDAPRLYLIHDDLDVDAFWLARYQDANQPYGWLANTELVEITSVAELLNIFGDAVNGSVLWDANVPATLNVATTIAGVEDVVVLRAGSDLAAQFAEQLPVQASLVDMFVAGADTLPDSNTPSTGSPKNDAYLWAKEQYLDTGRANPQFLAYFLDGWPAALYLQGKMTRGGVYAIERDYPVQQRGFVFDLSPFFDMLPNDDPHQSMGTDEATFRAIAESAYWQANGGLIKVWGFPPWYEKYAILAETGQFVPQLSYKSEWDSVWIFSQNGGYLQGGAGDVYGLAMSNVSVHKFGPPPPPEPLTPERPTVESLTEQGYLTAEGQVNPDLTFLLFYMGDYDIVHTTSTLLANHRQQPWLDEHRGDIPLAWGINPAMVEDIPGIMSYLYSTRTDQDFFVGPNSGAGYVSLDGLPEMMLLRWLSRSRDWFQAYGYDVQGFLLNGKGEVPSGARLSAFTWVAPTGVLALESETDEPWPRLQMGTPISALSQESLVGPPEEAARVINDVIYRRMVLEEGRPPFIAIRMALQTPELMYQTQQLLTARQAQGVLHDADGTVITPNFTVVDPYTYFFLLETWLLNNG